MGLFLLLGLRELLILGFNLLLKSELILFQSLNLLHIFGLGAPTDLSNLAELKVAYQPYPRLDQLDHIGHFQRVGLHCES